MRGIVKNRVTGQPIERALVDGQMDAVLTDHEGRFELHLQCGYAQLRVRRPGYLDRRDGSMFPVQVEPDTEAVINLIPAATIIGHVSVSNGGDPGDLYFGVYKAEYQNGHVRWDFIARAQTDGNGVFRVYALDSPAKYLLCSQLTEEDPGVPSTSTVRYGYPSTCYPSEGNGVLRLAPGEQAEIEISVTREPFYRVSIAVNSPQGPGTGFNLFSHLGAALNVPLRWIADDQTWEVWLPNGTYEAESHSWGPSPGYGRLDFKVADSAVSGLRMTVLPPASAEVIIHKQFTATGNQPPADEAYPGVELELIPVERGLGRFSGNVGLSQLEGREPGHFEAENVSPGRYWVRASYSLEGYISALSSGATDLTREPLVIGPGNTVAPIELTVRDDVGTIACTVNNVPNTGAPNSGVVFVANLPVVYAIPLGPRFSRLPHASLLGEGLARIGSLGPGLYSVVALSKFQDLDRADPAELANLIAQGTTVRVEAGTTTSVRVNFAAPEDEVPNP